MKSKFFLLAGLLVYLSGCQEDIGTFDTHPNNNTNLGIQKIINNATEFIGSLNPSNTRSSSRIVGKIKAITTNDLFEKPCGRSSVSDTLLYLINYKENKGFALMGANSKLHRIYAISDEGNLHFSDTIENKGLAMFFDGIKYEIQNRLSNDSEPHKEIPDKDMYYKIESDRKISPMLWPEVTKWSQSSPYNKYCFTSNGEQAAVGCAAVAVAQVMSRFNCPTKIDDQKLPWRTMKKGTSNNSVALLMAKLGESYLLEMDYGIKESSAYTSKFDRTFTQLGYKSTSGFSTYKEADLLEWLEGTKPFSPFPSPVIVFGYGKQTNNIYENGHFWVIDGYIRNKIYLSYNNEYYYFGDYDTTLLHCIWGWGGMCNGYYYINKNIPEFDLSNGAETPDIGESGSINRNYKYKLLILSGFNPI